MQALARDSCNFLYGVRTLFDPEAPLYQNVFADLKTTISIVTTLLTLQPYTPSVYNPRWFEGLSKGMKVDVLKEERINMDRVSGWAVATVKEIARDMVTFQYDNMPLPATYSDSAFVARSSV
jgi:hypothetical protein